MKTAEKVQPGKLASFDIGGVLVALELGKTDASNLNYLKFLSDTFYVREVAVLHVVPKITLFDKALEYDTDPDVLGDYKINEEVVEELRGKIKGRFVDKPEMDIVFDVKEGEPLEQLLREAEILEPDLVLIGQNTDTTAHGILAKNLVRKVDCDALVVPDTASARIRTILVPIDFSPYSLMALKKAVAMAESMEPKPEVIALHVYDMPNFSTYKISRTPDQFKDMIHSNRIEGASNFINSNIKETDVDITVEMIARTGPGTGHYVMEFAKQEEVDLIIMGAKGHSRVELLLLGSVTEKVLSSNEHIPVLVVK
ncbi:MAG: universal stress protein [Bacteroidetes bacterium]|nr:MAG: universal stress protein [Bacteroidota bacterium]